MTETVTTTAEEARARKLGAATHQVISSISNNCQLLGLTVPEMIEVSCMALMFLAARQSFVGGERAAIQFAQDAIEAKADQIAQAVVLERATKTGRSN